jgi:hypothetical protein
LRPRNRSAWARDGLVAGDVGRDADGVTEVGSALTKMFLFGKVEFGGPLAGYGTEAGTGVGDLRENCGASGAG